MARESGKKSFLDFFKMKDLDDEDEFDDDLFDDDDDDDDYQAPARQPKARFHQEAPLQERASSASAVPKNSGYGKSYAGSNQQNNYKAASGSSYGRQAKSSGGSKLVDFNSRQQRPEANYNHGDVYVIKPIDINDAQMIAKYLKTGLTIVINLEGVEVTSAQRIIDFVGGACYALDGSINGISANIFIAAPNSTEVSGDLREELVNNANVSPQLGDY